MELPITILLRVKDLLVVVSSIGWSFIFGSKIETVFGATYDKYPSMTLVVVPDFLDNLFFCLIVHVPDKIVIETHGPFFKWHVI